MPNHISINGNGIASTCCAALLTKAGYQVAADYHPRTASPILMLSLQTQKLLTDVFEAGHLFDGAIPISKRTVLWGQNREPMTLPHSGLVMSEATLLHRLWHAVTPKPSQAAPDWTIIAARSALSQVEEYEFGSRRAATYSVELRKTTAPESCWVESVESGWLFLIPSGENAGSLICVGADSSDVLAQSHLITNQIQTLGPTKGSFPAYPRIVKPLAGTNWIACGSAAVAFDPIAGEGTGNALREGILASAVVRALTTTTKATQLLTHYTNRINAGFLRHLHDCCRFYEAMPGPWWRAELQSLKQGIHWAQQELTAIPAPVYRLQGFELRPL
jgi:hypothetical protein